MNISCGNKVALFERAVRHEDSRANHVRERLLGCKRDGEAAKPEPGEYTVGRDRKLRRHIRHSREREGETDEITEKGALMSSAALGVSSARLLKLCVRMAIRCQAAHTPNTPMISAWI